MIESEEDISDAILGIFNDFESGLSTKEESMKEVYEIIIYIATLNNKKNQL